MSKLQFPVLLFLAVSLGLAAGLAIPWNGLRERVFPTAIEAVSGAEDDHDHAGETPEEHAAHARADLFEPVEVTVLHKDQEAVVVRSGELLQPGDRIAFNRAMQLMFALKTGSGRTEGHGHDHGHEH